MASFAGQDFFNNGYVVNPPASAIQKDFSVKLRNGFAYFPQGVLKVHTRMWTEFIQALDQIVVGGIPCGPSNVAGNWGGEVRANVNSPGWWSFHAGFLACDIAAPWNANGQGYQDGKTHGIPRAASALAAKYGLQSGGDWGSADAMHFEVHQTVDWYKAHFPVGGVTPPTPKPPAPPKTTKFPLPAGCYFGPLSGPAQSISGMAPSGSDKKWRPYIVKIQRAVGANADGLYGPASIAKVTAWQRTHNLNPDGLVGPVTWSKLGI